MITEIVEYYYNQKSQTLQVSFRTQDDTDEYIREDEFEIDYIETNGTIVTLELINSDPVFYPLITTGVGTTSVVFPFNVGDKIFIENCRQIITGETDTFNSKDYNYSFFTITSVDEGNCTITYDMSEVKPNFNATLDTGEAN